MQQILTWLLVGGIPLLLFVFFLLADPKGIGKACLSVLGFLIPPVLLGILCGGLYVFAFFAGELFIVPLLYHVREIWRYCHWQKYGIRTTGTFAGGYRGRQPRVYVSLPDGSRRTASARTLVRHTVGETLELYYDPAHPERCYLAHDSLTASIVYACLWLCAGAVCLLLVLRA